MKISHKLKKENELYFENYFELLDWFGIHITKINEFVLQCGQGKNENGYNIVKQ